MSGPPYPHPNPAPGSNQIDEFQIGTSPIGTIPPFDVWSTIISQYANSEILSQLIVDFSQYVDQTLNFDNFYDLIWNVDTAQGYGLDVWGRIVGVSRTVNLTTEADFGFEESTTGVGFGQGTFFAGAATTANYQLTDSAYRTLIFAKALSNISDGSIPSINQILLNLFPGRGNCYVQDGLDMTLEYVFLFSLSTTEIAVLQQSGALPKPTGVAASITISGRFVGSISGTTLTVNSVVFGVLVSGQTLSEAAAGTTLVSGGGNVWTVSVSQTLASTTIDAILSP